LTALSDSLRAEAMRRFELLRPYLYEEMSLIQAAKAADAPVRTFQRWVERYNNHGLVGLSRQARCDFGKRRLPLQIVEAIESFALQKPQISTAAIYRKLKSLTSHREWHLPSYATVNSIIKQLDPALVTLAHEGLASYRDKFEIIHRHQAERPNMLWQADHTKLDIVILDANSNPVRPWLTVVIDDHSRVITGFLVFMGVPSALQTSLALRQAIWRKSDPAWAVCGIPDILYVDHGSDFTSLHLEQVCADLRIELTFSAVARPQGRGKIERFFGTLNSEVFAELPGYLNNSCSSRPKLTLSDLNQVIHNFIVENYNSRPHSQTGISPKNAWKGDGWLPRLPENLEALDLLLIRVAKARIVRRDGIYFQGLRYMDPTLAAYVGENVTIRYDPRDITELRVFHHDRFLCRAVSTDHADRTISLKDIQEARIARRKTLRDNIAVRRAKISDYLLDQQKTIDLPAQKTSEENTKVKLALYEEDLRP
jgi:putative transposase